jgi:hypothetical protein
MLTEDQRYERYKAWCQMLGVEPAGFYVWRSAVGKISERHDPDRFPVVLQHAG